MLIHRQFTCQDYELFVRIVDEQVARQRLGQHWFITVYIAAYIQGLYTVYKGARVQGAVANWSDR
jgi:hypothetical protein